MYDFLLEKRKAYLFEFFNVDQKQFKIKRILNVIIFSMIAFFILKVMGKDGLNYLFIVLGGLIGYKLPYYKYVKEESITKERNRALFTDFIQSFIALSGSTGNVYSCLKACVPYTDEPLKFGLLRLIKNLEDDAIDNRNAYLEFAHYIDSSEAIVIMDMIYQFDEFGKKKETLKELESYATELLQNSVEQVIEKKSNSMDSLGLLPLLAGIFMSVGFVIIIVIHYFNEFISKMSL